MTWMKIYVSNKNGESIKYVNLDNIISYKSSDTSCYICRIDYVDGNHDFVQKMNNEKFNNYYEILKKSCE
jgi:hypothetical protein